MNMDVQFLEANTFINDRVLKSNFEAIFLASSVNVDPDFLSRRWSCAAMQNGNNFLRWCSPDVDKLLAQGIALTAQADRKKVYDQSPANHHRRIADRADLLPQDALGFQEHPQGHRSLADQHFLERRAVELLAGCWRGSIAPRGRR